jgi:hypothetical protein
MAVRVFCTNPELLLKQIKAGIIEGTIQTWSLDKDGDFTHSPTQWKYKAWLRPRIGQGVLVFRILGPTSTKMSKEVYAIYHGRFIEMLLAHFDTKFDSARASALAEEGDLLTY